jgi:PPOX class probable F420-dependent enzyme
MTDFHLDPSVPRDAAVLARLESEEIGWLGSNGRDGFPHAMPVWFVWHDGAIVTFSQPKAAKTKNLRLDPRALFHLEAGEDGEQVHVFQGTVEFLPETTTEWLARNGAAYRVKYAKGLANLGWTEQRLADDFSVVIAVRPHKLIG